MQGGGEEKRVLVQEGLRFGSRAALGLQSPLPPAAWWRQVREYNFERSERARQLLELSAARGRPRGPKSPVKASLTKEAALTAALAASRLGDLSLPKPHREEAAETKR